MKDVPVFWMDDPAGGTLRSPFVRQPAYSMVADRCDELEAVVREIASYEGPDHLLDINAKNMRDAAREALGPTSETSAQREAK